MTCFMFRNRGLSDGGAVTNSTIANWVHIDQHILPENFREVADRGFLTCTAKFGAVYSCAFNAVYPNPCKSDGQRLL